MAWLRFDDRMAFHRKILAAKNEAVGAWARAGSWSSGEGTDGLIPRDTALTIASEKIWNRLVEVRLAHEVPDGWEIHDFLDYNPAAEKVAAKRSARAEAGRRGGQRSGTVRRTKQPAEQSPSKTEATVEAIASANTQANGKQKRTPIPIPIPIPEKIETGGAPRRAEPSRAEEPWWRSAYEDAVTAGTAKKWGFPVQRTSGLRSALMAHCPDLSHADDWIRDRVGQFVADGGKPGRGDPYGPDGFLDWLNAAVESGETVPAGPGLPPLEPEPDGEPMGPDEHAELEALVASMGRSELRAPQADAEADLEPKAARRPA